MANQDIPQHLEDQVDGTMDRLTGALQQWLQAQPGVTDLEAVYHDRDRTIWGFHYEGKPISMEVNETQ